MGKDCGCRKNRERFIVKLPGGTQITKRTQAAAAQFAAKHPGSTVIKPAA